MSEVFDGLASCSQFTADMMRWKERRSSFKTALETIKFLRKIVVHDKYDNIDELLTSLTRYGRILWETFPSELIIKNTVLMVTKLVREENSRLIIGTDDAISPYDSLNKLWKEHDKAGLANIKKLRKGLIEAVKEVGVEMESCREAIAAQATELIQPREVLIVYALRDSPTLKVFLEATKSKARILSVVDSSSFDSSPDFVSPLVLCDVGGSMCEATKVVLPGVAVFPDGSCLVPAGALSICLSAQRHSVPVYILASFYKITPFFVPDLTEVNPMMSPNLPFSFAKKFAGNVEVLQPAFDLIPASLVTLYVVNSASILPSHVYRLIGDYYHPDDFTVE